MLVLALNVTDEALAELTRQTTTPVYLVKLGFGDFPFCSTNMTIEADGENWIGGKVDISSMANYQTLTLSIPNYENALSGSAASRDWSNAVCEIWLCIVKPEFYSAEPLADDDLFSDDLGMDDYISPAEAISTIKLFNGELVSASIKDGRVYFRAQRKKISTSFTPRERISAPKFNHLPVSGTVLERGGETIVLERA